MAKLKKTNGMLKRFFAMTLVMTLIFGVMPEMSVSAQSHEITVEPVPSPIRGGTVSGGGTFNDSQNFTMSATPNDGWYSQENQLLSTSATVSASVVYFTDSFNAAIGGFDIIVGGNKYMAVSGSGGRMPFFARFTQTQTPAPNQTFTVTTVASPANGGTVTGGGTYNPGATVTLTATPNSGWYWWGWREENKLLSTNKTLTFAASSNRTLTATFDPNPHTISVSAQPSNGGNVTGGG